MRMSVSTTSGSLGLDRREQLVEITARPDDLDAVLRLEEPHDTFPHEITVFGDHYPYRHRHGDYGRGASRFDPPGCRRSGRVSGSPVSPVPEVQYLLLAGDEHLDTLGPAPGDAASAMASTSSSAPCR